MPEPATRASWKTLPLPSERERFDFPVLYSDSDAERMRLGHVPTAMEDKWFIFFENGWLYFHRSWSGACVFGLKLDGSPNGVRVTEAWVSRDQAQFPTSGVMSERQLVQDLIKKKLLA